LKVKGGVIIFETHILPCFYWGEGGGVTLILSLGVTLILSLVNKSHGSKGD
jgi:hypothetical protein